MLVHELAAVIQQCSGRPTLSLIQQLGDLAQRRRQGDATAQQALQQVIRNLSPDQMNIVVRAASCQLDLMNLAEDRQRLRVLRQREEAAYPKPLAESIGAAVLSLKAANFDAARLRTALEAIRIELVFTAHPTEAKRRTLRRILGRIRQTLGDLEEPTLAARQRQRHMDQLRSDLVCLWLTDPLRPQRPTVFDEVDRGLYAAESAWQVLPEILRSLRQTVRQAYGQAPDDLPRFLRFGSWIGGDRDGNPFVTAEVTRKTLATLHQAAVALHLQECDHLLSSLTISTRLCPLRPELASALARAREAWPQVRPALEAINPAEQVRQWLAVIRCRLEVSRQVDALKAAPQPAYRGAAELIGDLQLLRQSLHQAGLETLARGRLSDWIDRAQAFGLHLTHLDLREHSRRLGQVVEELWAVVYPDRPYAGLSEAQRRKALGVMVLPDAVERVRHAPLTAPAADTLRLFELVHQAGETLGPEVWGTLIISMTHQPSHVLEALWLTRLGAALAGVPPTSLPIVPLYETIDDLTRAGPMLDALLSVPAYRRQVAAMGDLQVCMVGYSDSTKDGGYLAANWRLYTGQRDLAAVARRHGCRLMLFHGRGGALGRGGGPAARGILSLPAESVGGCIRMTEQGEVLAERYDDPLIARRHLEQVAWATLLVSARPAAAPRQAWVDLMEQAAARSLQAYRALVGHPGFTAYFRQATPIAGIETLPIASRPSRRTGQETLADLRAIPYTFAWTQTRQLLTAFYGLGTGLMALGTDALPTLRQMYQQWPFFRGLMDNVDLALAKCDMDIARQYAGLVGGAAQGQSVFDLIRGEYERTVAMLASISGQAQILETVPWLRQTIQTRNPCIDTLNFIQVELLHRLQETADSPADAQAQTALQESLRFTLQGVAAGMRATG